MSKIISTFVIAGFALTVAGCGALGIGQPDRKASTAQTKAADGAAKESAATAAWLGGKKK